MGRDQSVTVTRGVTRRDLEVVTRDQRDRDRP